MAPPGRTGVYPGMKDAEEPAIHLTGMVLNAIVAHARSTLPEECCGALLGDPVESKGRARVVVRAVPLGNEAMMREIGYQIPADYVADVETEAGRAGLAVVGFYHSHPVGPPVPSALDLALAWPWYSYLIVDPREGEARSWRLREDRSGFVAESLWIGVEAS